MEQNEKEQAEVKEDVNLGRIQYKLDYDFQQGQVRLLLNAVSMNRILSNIFFV